MTIINFLYKFEVVLHLPNHQLLIAPQQVVDIKFKCQGQGTMHEAYTY